MMITTGEEAEFQLTCLNFIGPDGSDEPAESTSQRFLFGALPISSICDARYISIFAAVCNEFYFLSFFLFIFP